MTAAKTKDFDSARSDAQRPTPPSSASPIDLVHLACQTCGDRALERSILVMLCHQIETAIALVPTVLGAERSQLAHRVRGAALSVGAFSLAESAAAVEANPGDAAFLSRFETALVETRKFAGDLA